MEYHEARSIREVQDCIRLNKYQKKGDIRSHMEYLEGLANSIAARIHGESQMGEVAWQHKMDLSKVQSVYEELKFMLAQREMAKLQKDSRPKGLF